MDLARAAVPPSPYAGLMLAGIAIGLGLWNRLAPKGRGLRMVYVGALAGAFLGAKLVYLGAEGWLHWGRPDLWLQLATGKTILGALLGGYAGVELAKRLVGYHGMTGDWFALIVPIGVALGRIGCLMQGCCLGLRCAPAWFTLADAAGQARWPAVPVEMLFNVVMVGVIVFLRWRRAWVGQHFHIYLMAYGLFRFIHEFRRDDPRLLGPLTGYHFAAIAVAALGLAAFIRRSRLTSPFPEVSSPTRLPRATHNSAGA